MQSLIESESVVHEVLESVLSSLPEQGPTTNLSISTFLKDDDSIYQDFNFSSLQGDFSIEKNNDVREVVNFLLSSFSDKDSNTTLSSNSCQLVKKDNYRDNLSSSDFDESSGDEFIFSTSSNESSFTDDENKIIAIYRNSAVHTDAKENKKCVKSSVDHGYEDLPHIHFLNIKIDEKVEMKEVGKIHSIVDSLVIVQANPGLKPLDMDTVLFLDGRNILGQVYEPFGPVGSPLYLVCFNTKEEITDKGLKINQKVHYAPDAPEYTQYVFVEQLKLLKGSDASWKNNSEPPPNCLDFSDDEQERESKRDKRKANKCQTNSSFSPKKSQNTEQKSNGSLVNDTNVSLNNNKQTIHHDNTSSEHQSEAKLSVESWPPPLNKATKYQQRHNNLKNSSNQNIFNKYTSSEHQFKTKLSVESWPPPLSKVSKYQQSHNNLENSNNQLSSPQFGDTFKFGANNPIKSFYHSTGSTQCSFKSPACNNVPPLSQVSASVVTSHPSSFSNPTPHSNTHIAPPFKDFSTSKSDLLTFPKSFGSSAPISILQSFSINSHIQSHSATQGTFTHCAKFPEFYNPCASEFNQGIKVLPNTNHPNSLPNTLISLPDLKYPPPPLPQKISSIPKTHEIKINSSPNFIPSCSVQFSNKYHFNHSPISTSSPQFINYSPFASGIGQNSTNQPPIFCQGGSTFSPPNFRPRDSTPFLNNFHSNNSLSNESCLQYTTRVSTHEPRSLFHAPFSFPQQSKSNFESNFRHSYHTQSLNCCHSASNLLSAPSFTTHIPVVTACESSSICQPRSFINNKINSPSFFRPNPS